MKHDLKQDKDYYIVVPIVIARVRIHVEKPTTTGIPISIDLKEVDWKILKPEYIPVDEFEETA
jgi:hypothetical protein